MARILLAHGFLGFASEGPLLHYFNGIPELLGARGHEVLAPQVSPLGSLEQRSQQLAAAIAARWPEGDAPIHVIAHSMGGLDARRVIARHPEGAAIRSLLCIGTPLLGSPVADAVLDHRHSLYPLIPDWLADALRLDDGALHDLTSRTVPQDAERPDVCYREIVCEAGSASPLFGLTRALGKLAGRNDGVVCCSSACLPQRQPLACWPVDHCEAIGWPSRGLSGLRAAFSPPAAHLARYSALADWLEHPH